MPALRFKTCRLLSGNVWNGELTIIQRRILRRLRNKKRSIKRKIYSRENLNSYIQSQTTRKLSLFYGDLPITEMHERKRTNFIYPFSTQSETRSDVIPVRLHFCETIPQARQLDKSSKGLKILDHPWRRTKTEWFRLLKTKRGCRLLLKSRFYNERTKKFGSEKVCLGEFFRRAQRMKRNLYHFKSLFLSKRRNKKNRNIPTRTRSPIIKIKRIELPTHYSEVNHRTPKAVVCYGPNIGHIPHDIRLKDPNLLLRSGKGRGQNI
ncbi:unnamed protein product [Withania somnifera]